HVALLPRWSTRRVARETTRREPVRSKGAERRLQQLIVRDRLMRVPDPEPLQRVTGRVQVYPAARLLQLGASECEVASRAVDERARRHEHPVKAQVGREQQRLHRLGEM